MSGRINQSRLYTGLLWSIGIRVKSAWSEKWFLWVKLTFETLRRANIIDLRNAMLEQVEQDTDKHFVGPRQASAILIIFLFFSLQFFVLHFWPGTCPLRITIMVVRSKNIACLTKLEQLTIIVILDGHLSGQNCSMKNNFPKKQYR